MPTAWIELHKDELQNVDYFKQVKVLDGTVSWPHGQDICPDTLFEDRK